MEIKIGDRIIGEDHPRISSLIFLPIMMAAWSAPGIW
jgi:hypothetical protein